MTDPLDSALHRVAHDLGMHDEVWSAMSTIRDALQAVKDEGTHIDSGGGLGSCDLWVTIGGIEFFVAIKKSGNQLAKEAAP